MLSVASNVAPVVLDKVFPFVNWRRSTNEVIDDLLLVIQSILAGTVTISTNVLSDTSVECKIYLSSELPYVKVQYEVNSNVESVQSTCKEGNGNIKGNSSNTNSKIRSCEIVYDNINGESDSSLGKVKQEMPELLTVLKTPGSDENKEVQFILPDRLQEDPETTTNSESVVYSETCICAATQTESGSDMDDDSDGRPYRRRSRLKSYKCKCCGKSFKQKKTHQQHQMVHSGEKPYACSYCPKSFNRKESRQRHEMIHTGEKPYLCSYCGRSFRRMDSRHRHEMNHAKAQPNSCNFCGKYFRTEEEIKWHEMIHTGDKPYCCNFCGKSFETKQKWQKHEIVHSEDIVRLVHGDTLKTEEIIGI